MSGVLVGRIEFMEQPKLPQNSQSEQLEFKYGTQMTLFIAPRPQKRLRTLNSAVTGQGGTQRLLDTALRSQGEGYGPQTLLQVSLRIQEDTYDS